MKKLLTYILVAAAMIAFAAALLVEDAGAVDGIGNLKARQDEVHAAAELLRELGVAEDSEAIKALQEEWWRCQARMYPRYTEAEVVMLAKLLYGEAGG